MTNSSKYILLALVFPSLLAAQPWPDSRWVGGFEENPGVPGYANYSIRFTAGGGQVDTLDWNMKFESTVASFTDSTGRLLFVSNGCYVADGQGNVLANGDGLNAGEMHDWTCDKVGYVAPRGAMALPAPGKPGLYYLFHMGLRYDAVRKLRYGPLYYSVIDMNANGGKGAVTIKNKLLLGGELEPFSAVRHGNGRDWWLVAPAWHTNSVYRALLSPTGLQTFPSQSLGQALAGHRVGATTFSLDGSRFARYHCDQGATVADFDRCTGAFSQPIFIPAPFSFLQGGGAAFSPDSRKLYVSSQSALYVADLEDAAPKWDTVFYLYDNWDWGTTLHHMQYAPDGKLYVSTHSRANYLSALSFPPDGGLPSFSFRALPLKVYSERTLPHFPNFRLFDYPNSPCDTLGINTPISSIGEAVTGSLRVWPNPAHEMLQVECAPDLQPARWALYTALGQQALSGTWPAQQTSLRLSLSHLAPGVYFLMVTDGQGRQRVSRVAVE
ncbi:MAG TPA: T9SS type A sorting domain-containing protein [Saprospiraceae bacterium]|nr:T9SS type A sorting domain-containing protein [Saprospiraceae bacterium]